MEASQINSMNLSRSHLHLVSGVYFVIGPSASPLTTLCSTVAGPREEELCPCPVVPASPLSYTVQT